MATRTCQGCKTKYPVRLEDGADRGVRDGMAEIGQSTLNAIVAAGWGLACQPHHQFDDPAWRSGVFIYGRGLDSGDRKLASSVDKCAHHSCPFSWRYGRNCLRAFGNNERRREKTRLFRHYFRTLLTEFAAWPPKLD